MTLLSKNIVLNANDYIPKLADGRYLLYGVAPKELPTDFGNCLYGTVTVISTHGNGTTYKAVTVVAINGDGTAIKSAFGLIYNSYGSNKIVWKMHN